MGHFFHVVGYYIDRAVSLSRYVGYSCIAGIAALMTAGTIARYVFDAPFLFTEELVMVLAAIFAGTSIAYCFLVNAHVNVNILTRKLSPKKQEWFERWREFLAIVVLGLILIPFIQQVLICLAVDRRFATIPSWPQWPIRVVLCLGVLLALVYLVKNFINGWIKMLRRDR